MDKVAIIDYGMCNLDSMARAVEECGGDPVVTDTATAIESAARIILPGVGAFAVAMQNIRARGLDEVLHRRVRERGVPVLGVCLGMQIFAAQGVEGEPTKGLGWIDAEVCRFKPVDGDERIPHIGWNEVEPTGSSKLFAEIDSGKDFYFAHSYHLACTHDADIVAMTPYCGRFVSAVQHGNIYGTQFHPEKSQRVGFAVLRNFLAI